MTPKKIDETHNRLRNILIAYGNEEHGDVIIDEISSLFGFPMTPYEDDNGQIVYRGVDTNDLITK